MMRQVLKRATLPIAFLAILVLFSLILNPMLGAFGHEIIMNLEAKNLAPSDTPGFLGLLGTDELGKKLFPLIIYASKYSLSIGIISAVLTTIIGTFIGIMSGFWGDQKLQIKRCEAITSIPITILLFFYLYVISNLYNGISLSIAIGVVLILGVICFLVMKWFLGRFKWMTLPVSLPVDLLSVKIIEILFALPLYFILLTLSALFEPSLTGLILIISLTSWPHTAMLVRTEVIRIREMDFVVSLRLLGINNLKIIYRHILPLASRPAIINMAFIASSLLIVESTLSFIGIGLPENVISWGKILAQFKRNTSSWWIALFPGLFTFITVLSLHRIGRIMTELQKKFI